MHIHKRLIIIVGLGMLLLVLPVALSLSTVMTAFSSVATELERESLGMQRIGNLESQIEAMSRDLHYFGDSGEPVYRRSYEISRTDADELLTVLDKIDSSPSERELISALRADIVRIDDRAGRLFALKDPAGRDRSRRRMLLMQSDLLVEQSERNVERHVKSEQVDQIRRVGDYVGLLRMRVLTLFSIMLVLSAGFLLGFGVYIYRAVALPLKRLQEGATELSRGNLDYQLRLTGIRDVTELADQFNAMAAKLKQSYTELERKLLDRTNELTAIDSVALALSQASNLTDMLSRSLAKIMDSLSVLEPRGGIFLCDPDGEKLRLVTHQGLTEEFVQAEQEIHMGECLCGHVAQSAEVLYSDRSCNDPRHTRGSEGDDHAHIIIPIKTRGIVLGVIFLYPRRQVSLKPSDIQMFDTIGSQLGLALENLRFYAEVKESSLKFWDLFENSRDILFTLDRTGVVTAANRAAETFCGCAKPDLVGKNCLNFLTPESARIARRMLERGGAGARRVIEFEVVKHDTSRAFLEVSARSIVKNDEFTGYQVSARDMTEQKAIREKLRQAERVGAIGEVVITVRHEINNPLTTVIGNVELLLERFGERDPDLKKRLEAVLNNSLRIAEIVQKLQAIKRDRVVDYVKGVPMTDLKQEEP
jgi:PAS domain S-box-containing protein